MSENT